MDRSLRARAGGGRPFSSHVGCSTGLPPSWVSSGSALWTVDSPSGSDGKASAHDAGDPGLILGREDLLEKEMATHSSTLAWRIPWTEEPGRLQSMGVAKSRTQLSDFPFFLFFLDSTCGVARGGRVLGK